MAKASQLERMNALEHSHKVIHQKIDHLLTSLSGDLPTGTAVVDANGTPWTATPAPEAVPNERHVVSTHDGTTNLLAVLLPFLKQQAPPPPPSPWAGLIEVLAPILIEKLLDRPDPLEQFARIQELIQPGMTDQVMQAALPALMPALVAKLTGESSGDGKKGEPSGKGDLADAFKAALGGLDIEDLVKLAQGQADPDGKDGA